QTVTIGGAITGSFTLSFNGQTTAALPYNVAATGGVTPTASVQNALNALSSIGGARGPRSAAPTRTPYTLTFRGSLALTKLPALIAAGANGTTTQVAEATAGAGDTIVADAATLQLQGTGNVASEDLTINGVGIGNAGALQNVSGNNAWGKPITLG